MRSLFTRLLLATTSLLALLPIAATDMPVAEPIRIGVTTSQSGSLAGFGAEQQRGIEMWAADVNERGALLGREVKLVIRDDASDPSKVAALYEQLITQDKVDFLISPYSSAMTLAASDVAERSGVPMVAVATASTLWTRGYKNLFGLYTPAQSNMDPVLKLAHEKGLATVAIAYLDDEFPRDVAEGVRSKASAHELNVVFDRSYGADLATLPTLVKDLAATNADVVIVASYMADAVAFARASKAAGVKPKIMAFSGAPALPEFAEQVGVANVQGMLSTVQWSRDVRMPGAFDFAYRFERKNGRYPSYDAAGGYSAGQVLEAAVRLAGTTDRSAVRTQLGELKFRPILGHYRVDATGVATEKETYLVQCQDDHISLVYPKDVARYELKYPFPG